jgi:hypothetical protein
MATKYLPFVMLGCVACSSSSLLAYLMMNSSEDPATGPTGPTGPTTPQGPVPVLPSAQYVKVERPTDTYPGNIVNLAEIEVFDKAGTNIALNAVTTGGPGAHGAGPFANLTDGEYANFAHTTGDGIAFMTIDLGAVKEIAKIVITNRNPSGGSGRLNDAKLILLDSSNRLFTTPVIDTEKLKITYDFNVATPAWVYADA